MTREYSSTVVMEETNNSVLTTLQKRLIVFFFFVFFIMFLLLIVRILNESGKKKVNFTFHFKTENQNHRHANLLFRQEVESFPFGRSF